LRFTGKNKKQLLWEAYNLLGNRLPQVHGKELFRAEYPSFELPDLETSRLEDAYNELELLGYPLSMSMFDLLRTPFRGDIKVRDMPQHIGKTVRMVANFACEKTVRTKNNKKM